MAEKLNIAWHLSRLAAEQPARTAIILARNERRLTFAELEALSNRYAGGLSAIGLKRGMRTLLMVRPGIEFVALVFALFKVGAVPVMIDPGMGARRMLECLRQVDLQAFIGIPVAHVARLAKADVFRGAKVVVTVGRRWLWGGASLEGIAKNAGDVFEPADTSAGEIAAILFTSGSTGPAKGVVYEHGMFDVQVRMIQREYGIQSGEVDLPTFPLFSLFSIAMGMSIVIPEMDASHPGRVNPAKIVGAIEAHAVTNTFGSPAVWAKVAPYCLEKGIRLSSLRRILIAGAATSDAVIEQLRQILPAEGEVFTPYGATESLPVSSICGRERMRIRSEGGAGAGTCVGRPVDGVEVRVIRMIDGPIPKWSDDLQLPPMAIGEIVVRGDAVTKEYWNLPAATAQAKIQDGDGLWHRIGDTGYFDRQGRLWFCGRKSHRVRTARGVLFTECIEPLFGEHPQVSRAALVGLERTGTASPKGMQAKGVRAKEMPAEEVRSEVMWPVVVIELKKGVAGRGQSAKASVEDIAGFVGRRAESIRGSQGGSTIARSQLGILGNDYGIAFHRSLPVDVRHNAKINREALREWVASRRGSVISCGC